jgi:hypothetical protein
MYKANRVEERGEDDEIKESYVSKGEWSLLSEDVIHRGVRWCSKLKEYIMHYSAKRACCATVSQLSIGQGLAWPRES